MNAITSLFLMALETNIKKHLEEEITKNHYDGHTYTFKGMNLTPYKRNDTEWVVILTLELDSVYMDGFEDSFKFKYAISKNAGKIGAFTPQVPLSQDQVFAAYDTWAEILQNYMKELQKSIEKQNEKKASIHKELIQKMWSPERLHTLLETSGWNVIEGV